MTIPASLKRTARRIAAAWLFVFGDARREMKPAPAPDATPETPGKEPSAP